MLVCEMYPTNIDQIIILLANMCYATQMATLIVAMNGNHKGHNTSPPYKGCHLFSLIDPLITLCYAYKDCHLCSVAL